MNRMEFLEPWRRIYAGPRVRSAHPVLHSRPAFACMAGSSESCTHSPEGNTPVAAVAATGCAPRGSGWSRGHDGSAAPSPLVWAAAWDMPGRTGLVRRSSPRASSRNDALASTITLRRALLRGQFAHEAWGYTLYSLYRTARGLRRWPSLRGTSAWRRRLSKDYTLRSTMVLHGAVSRAPRSRRWSRPRRLWRQPLLSQISSTRGPAWGGLRVDVPRGPKRSRGANCLYQEVHELHTGAMFCERGFAASWPPGVRCRWRQERGLDLHESTSIASRSTRPGLPAGLRSPRPGTRPSRKRRRRRATTADY